MNALKADAAPSSQRERLQHNVVAKEPLIDTSGLIQLVRAITRRCECENRRRHEDCVGPVDRWWIRDIIGSNKAAAK